MKRIFVIIVICGASLNVPAQSHEIEQLLLNVEKLMQFRKILDNMYDGYQLLHKGYTTIKDISEGNFSLHKTFLDRLFEVNPVVRDYKRIGDIISSQLALVREHKNAFSHFKQSRSFSPKEIDYMQQVYGGLLDGSLKNLEELAVILTAGKVRMSDDERLQAIDRLYNNIEDQLAFLREFNNSTYVLMYQREKDQMEINQSRKVNGLN